MKKSRLFFCLAMLLCIYFPVRAQTFSGNGSGTETAPYQVTSAEQLREMHNFIGAAHEGTHFILMNDIDLDTWITTNNPTEGWIPIGQGTATGLNSFRGIFNGNNKTISNLWIERTAYQTGLFASTNMGAIYDLTVKVKEGKKVKAGNHTGILVGDGRCALTNCHVFGTVEGGAYIGGLVGRQGRSSPVKNCSANCIVNRIAGGDNCGGLMGSVQSPVENCTSSGEVNSDGNYVGGLIGRADTGSGIVYYIAYCSSSCTVNASSASTRVGGLIGGAVTGGAEVVKHSFATGNVTGNNNIGGLIGESLALLENCYATGNVTGNDNVGGLAGTVPSFSNCYASGAVNGNSKVGGLGGTVSQAVSNSVALNTSIAGTSAHRIAGDETGTISSCFALETIKVNGTAVSGGSADGVDGLNKTLTQLQTKSTYEEELTWDFSSTWKIAEGAYPVLLSYEELKALCLVPESVTVTTTFNEGLFDARISWISTGNAFNIYRNGELVESNITALSFEDTSLPAGNYKWCVVSACGEEIESDPICVEATCKLPYRTITASSLGFGSVFPQKEIMVIYGEDKQFTFIPQEGLQLMKILVDGVNIADSVASQSYTFKNISEDHTIEGIFEVKYSGEGDGSADNPYQIVSAWQLAELHNFVSPYYGKPHFIIMNDFSLILWSSSYEPENGWDPIGNLPDYAFYGILNGNNKTIKEFWIDRDRTDYVGLFGIIGDGGGVENLTIEIAQEKAITGRNYTGALAGSVAGNIKNCHVSGAINGGTAVGSIAGEVKEGFMVSGCSSECTVYGAGRTTGDMHGEYTGGLIGISYSPVENSHTSGTIISKNDRVGGLIGQSYGTVTNCYSSCTVECTSVPYGFEIGGLIGQSFAGVSDCYATGDVTAKTTRASGGLIGRNKAEVVDCHASGNVEGFFYTGGLIGHCEGSITGCYATGTISGTNKMGGLVGLTAGPITNCYATGNAVGSDHVGGLAGLADTGGDIHNCYATGDIIATSRVPSLLFLGFYNSYFGGLVGESYGNTISNCYTTGNINAAGNWFVGGIVGYGSYMNVSNCYASGKVIGAKRTEYEVNTFVGGIAGTIDWEGTISGCVAANDSIGGGGNAHRIAGYVADDLTNCFAVEDMIVNGAIVGTGNVNELDGLGKSLTTLQQQPAYASNLEWNFSNVWKLNCPGGMFPIFQWQPDVDCPCIAPRSLRAVASVDGDLFKVQLSWESLSESFNVYRGDELVASAITATTYADTNVPAGMHQWCVVAACADKGAEFSCVKQACLLPEFIITTSASYGGHIAPGGAVAVVQGENQAFTFVAEKGYVLTEIVVDGVNVPDSVVGNNYTFKEVSKSHTIAAKFGIKTGLEEGEEVAPVVYPNPTTGKLKIESAGQSINTVQIFDTMGSLLYETTNNNATELYLDLSAYPAGIYFLKVDGRTVKLLKQ